MICKVSETQTKLINLGIILYFNLPFEQIIQQKIQPIKIAGRNTENNTIQAMLEAFEDKQNSVRQANVILMKVEENEDKFINSNDDGKITEYIVGGYASHGWSASYH